MTRQKFECAIKDAAWSLVVGLIIGGVSAYIFGFRLPGWVIGYPLRISSADETAVWLLFTSGGLTSLILGMTSAYRIKRARGPQQ